MDGKIVSQSDAKIGDSLSDLEAMRLAIQEAYKGAPYVSPNPLVGAVVLDSKSQLIGRGYHQIYGGPHAEVNALSGLSQDQLKDASVFVTLEPCAHQGKTPSCARMLAKLPLKRVVFGLIDPNPLVAGQGAQILREAKIEVQNYSQAYSDTPEMNLTKELEEVAEVFLWNFRTKKIFCALKVAQSLDGKIALWNNKSQWITSAESRQYGHYLRGVYDSILVGRGTIQADDPRLDIRHPELNKMNKVIVLDSKASLFHKLENLNLRKAHQRENIFWCIGQNSLNQEEILKAKALVNVVECPVNSDKIHIPKALELLYSHGIRSTLVEGGGEIISSFLKERLLQKLFVFTAPKVLGKGKSWSESFQVSDITEGIFLESMKCQALGPDFLLSASVKQ